MLSHTTDVLALVLACRCGAMSGERGQLRRGASALLHRFSLYCSTSGDLSSRAGQGAAFADVIGDASKRPEFKLCQALEQMR